MHKCCQFPSLISLPSFPSSNCNGINWRLVRHSDFRLSQRIFSLRCCFCALLLGWQAPSRLTHRGWLHHERIRWRYSVRKRWYWFSPPSRVLTADIYRQDPEGLLFYHALSDMSSAAGTVSYSVFYNSESPRAIRIDFFAKKSDGNFSSTRFVSVCLLFTRGFRSLTTSVQFLTKDTVSNAKSSIQSPTHF